MKILLKKKKTILRLCLVLAMGIMSLTPNIVVKAENGDDASDYEFNEAVPLDLFEENTSYTQLKNVISDGWGYYINTLTSYKCIFYVNGMYYQYIDGYFGGNDEENFHIFQISNNSLKKVLEDENSYVCRSNTFNHSWINNIEDLDSVIMYFFDIENNPLFKLNLKDIDNYAQDLTVHIELTDYEYVYDSNKYIIGVKVEGTIDKDIDDFVAELSTFEDDFELDTVTYDANTHTFSGICNINKDFELRIYVKSDIYHDDFRDFYFSNITSYNRQRELELNQGAEPPTTQPDDDNKGGGTTPQNPTTPDGNGGGNTSTPPTGNDGQTGGSDNQPSLPEVGTKKTVSNGVYQVTKSSATSKEVVFTKPQNSKKTSVTIPATIKIDGQTYKVTEVAAKAFKGNKKIKSVTIGNNVKKIGKEAFSGCSKLKTIKIKSTELKSVGKNAIKGINAKATIKVPSKQLSKYKKLFKNTTGFKKSMKIKK